MPHDTSTHDAAMMDRAYMSMAARAGLRAIGRVEPNPMVGCAIARDGVVLAIGHHRRFGGLHAEREALASARASGIDPRGATVYVTLEPCNGHGKQPPCTQALVEAGIARVVYAARDPNPGKSGGAEMLRASGIAVDRIEHRLAERLSAAFIKGMGGVITGGLPWVTAKWAQTLDGRIATRTGESQWISGEISRRRVHRMRMRVDAILTGIGTVLADDPMLTPRLAGSTRATRRLPRRIVIDSKLMTPVDSKLVKTAHEAPVTIVTTRRDGGWPARREILLAAGVDVLDVGTSAEGEVDLRAALEAIRERHATASVLVEAGPRLLGAMLAGSLVDEAIVYLAPMILADDQARTVATGRTAPRLADASRWRLARSKQSGEDLELWYSLEAGRGQRVAGRTTET